MMKSTMRAVVLLVITVFWTMSIAKADGYGPFDPAMLKNDPAKYKEMVTFMTQMMTERLDDLQQGNAIINQLDENIQLYEQKPKDALLEETRKKLDERYKRVADQLKEWRQIEREFKAKYGVLQKYFEIYDKAKNYPRAMKMKQAQMRTLRAVTQQQELMKAVMSNYVLLAEEAFQTIQRQQKATP